MVVVLGGSVVNGVEMVEYPSAHSLLSFCTRMSSAGELAVSVVVFTGKTLNNAGPWPAFPATPAHLGTISAQVTSVKLTLFSVMGTKNIIMTERFINFLHSQFDISNFSFVRSSLIQWLLLPFMDSASCQTFLFPF